MGESLDVAIGFNTPVKFKIENKRQKYQHAFPAVINYVLVKNESTKEKEEETKPACDVYVTV